MAQLVACLVWDQEAGSSSLPTPTMSLIDELNAAHYVSFTSYKKDGTPVALPVWIVAFEDGYAFTTEDTSFKVKRVGNNSAVALQKCNVKGVIAAGATQFAGTATVLLGSDAERVRDLVKKKYFVMHKVLFIAHSWARLRGKRPDRPECAIKVVINR